MKAMIDKKYYASLTLGFPLIRDLNGAAADDARLHFAVNAQL